jgi:hypothetical protein
VAFLYEFILFRLFSLYQGFEAYAFGVLCFIHTLFTLGSEVTDFLFSVFRKSSVFGTSAEPDRDSIWSELMVVAFTGDSCSSRSSSVQMKLQNCRSVT